MYGVETWLRKIEANEEINPVIKFIGVTYLFIAALYVSSFIIAGVNDVFKLLIETILMSPLESALTFTGIYFCGAVLSDIHESNTFSLFSGMAQFGLMYLLTPILYAVALSISKVNAFIRQATETLIMSPIYVLSAVDDLSNPVIMSLMESADELRAKLNHRAIPMAEPVLFSNINLSRPLAENSNTKIELKLHEIMSLHPHLLEHHKFEKSLCCPITGKLMKDPVMLVPNYITTTIANTYERHAVSNWLSIQKSEPATDESCAKGYKLIKNTAVEDLILAELQRLYDIEQQRVVQHNKLWFKLSWH